MRGGTPPPLRIEKLVAEHAIAAFSSGDAAIDAFLRDHAIPEQAMGLSQICIAEERSRPRSVVGFFTLSPHSINLDSRLLVALGVHNDEVPYPKVGGYHWGDSAWTATSSAKATARPWWR